MDGLQANNISTLFHAIAYENDERAFEKLFYLYYARLVRFCVEYAKSQETAEDIVADLFARLWVKRHSLKEIRCPESYLFKAAKNGALNNLRRLSQVGANLIDEAELHKGHLNFINSPQSLLESKELVQLLTNAIESLPSQSRLILRLVKEEGFKAREVAEILQVSVRTVENQLYRALCRLEKVLALHPKKRSRSMLPVNKLASAFFCLLP